MCGIAGILRVHAPGAEPASPWESIPEQWLDVLDDSIKHRGPDGAGRFRDRATRPDGTVVDVALVHRRLSIIDLACGHQPMVSLAKGEGVLPVKTHALGPGLGLYEPDGHEWLKRTRSAIEEERAGSTGRPAPVAPRRSSLVAVAFNGCIYNHRELRKELQAAGHVFSTDHSDTEVLVHGWREWGDLLPDHLDGMYAITVWDHQRGDIWFGQDLAHEKRLFIDSGDADRLVAFSVVPASLPRLYAAMGSAPSATSEDWLGDWIRFGASSDPCTVGGPWVFHRMLHSSAEYIGSRRGDGTRRAPLPTRDNSIRLTSSSVDEMVGSAVRSRLEADVDIGCFLSGGVDSSLIAYHAAQASGDRRLRTFCVRMPSDRYDESAVAEQAAKIIGSDHTTLDCRPAPAQDLITLIHQLGLPFGDSSLLPTLWVSRAAREVVKVAISGDGGDELFCGYDRYVAARMLQRMGWMVRSLPGRLLPDRHPRGVFSRTRRLVDAARHGYPELLAIFPLKDLRRLLQEDDLGWYRIAPFDTRDPAGEDFWFYLPDDILRKSDTASMSVALEVRSPLLNVSLVEACLRAPYEDLMPHGQRKGLLRHVARKYFPSEIVDRPKMGFAIPIGDWFRSDYGEMRTLLLDHLTSAEPFGPPSLGIDLNMDFVRRMLKEHDEAGEDSLFPWKGRDHSQRLYMLLVLSIWAKWLGGMGR